MRGSARLVLASKSPARLTTLRNAGLNPLVMVSSVDEGAVAAALPTSASPAQLVSALAEAKAVSVARDLAETLNSAGAGAVGLGEWAATGITAKDVPSAQNDSDGPNPGKYLILGCDSMLEIGGKMVGKPHTAEVARQRIREMRGTDATLLTGHSLVAVYDVGHLTALGDLTGAGHWKVAKPDTQAASTIVHFGDISDEEIEAYVDTGEPLKVAGSFTIDGLGGPFVRGVTGDPHSVVGVSLPLLRDLVKDAGVFWPDLWEVRG